MPERGSGLKGMPEGDSNLEQQGPFPNMMPVSGSDVKWQGGDSGVKSGGGFDNKSKEEDFSGKW
ncbi:MAG: hypothetical protein BMS9Abin02_0218 [Anaerolineae bacterium]|nr:MAG: hypothetical protein BMS9Abin02_0218 [Anaerolineae bacterium]